MPYDNYPEAMTNNAKRGLRLNEEVGGKCATAVGKETARILANKETLSEARTKRMYSFLSRARTYYNPDDTEACGTISYLLWGGDTALRWSESKVKAMKEENNNEIAELRKQYGDNVELRTAEVRAAGDDSLVVEGYASNFEVEYDLGYFKDYEECCTFVEKHEIDLLYLYKRPSVTYSSSTFGKQE